MLLGLTTAALALAALAPTLPPTVTKYKIVQRLEQEVDATSLGGPKQSTVIKTTSFITVTLADSAKGKAMKVVIDSVTADSLPAMLPADSIKAARGMTYTGWIDEAGKVQNVKSTGKQVPGLQLEGLLKEMWPRMRTGTKVGDAWTDTTTSSNNIGGGELTTRSISSYKASKVEKVGSVSATRLDATVATQLAGSQAAGGGTADIEGSGTGTGYLLMAPDGRYLGGEMNGTNNLTVTLIGAQSGTIPVTLKTSSVATVLP